MFRREGFIFISSPGSITPFHMDPEYNFLLQIRGEKQISIWGGKDRRFYQRAHSRNIFLTPKGR